MFRFLGSVSLTALGPGDTQQHMGPDGWASSLRSAVTKKQNFCQPQWQCSLGPSPLHTFLKCSLKKIPTSLEFPLKPTRNADTHQSQALDDLLLLLFDQTDTSTDISYKQISTWSLSFPFMIAFGTDEWDTVSQSTVCFASDQVNKANSLLILQEARRTCTLTFDV